MRVQLVSLILAAMATTAAAPPATAGAAARQAALERLLVVGSALYVAAHPDDENTAMLAYLAQGRKVRTAYLSLTRGEGGQNLIGPEQGQVLGVIRTGELLAAREIDGAEQFFTRAVDFGYSKTASETLALWDREAVLGDIVRVIRTFRPDVVITRFPATGEGGHGHHTASAILAAEAFAAAGDPARFPEHLTTLQPWSPVRLVWNSWRPQGPERSAATPDPVTVDLGAWDPLLGESYTQLAARARTMHKSQGFGSAWRRGSLPNTLEHRAGTPARTDLFDDVDLTWGRLPGGVDVQRHLAAALAAHSPGEPHRAIPHLAAALAALGKLPEDPWVAIKAAEIRAALADCLGLWVEAGVAVPVLHPGRQAEISVTIVNRSPLPVILAGARPPWSTSTPGNLRQSLDTNQPVTRTWTVVVPPDVPPSAPHWLRPPAPADGDAGWGILSRLPSEPVATVVVDVAGVEVTYRVPVRHRFTDPVDGEVTREPVVAPPLSLRFSDPVVLFPTRAPRSVTVTVRSWQDGVRGSVALELPAGWRCEPSFQTVAVDAANGEQTVEFLVSPPEEARVATVTATVSLGDGPWWPALADETVALPHIPRRVLFLPATMRAVREDIRVPALRVGYVAGAGDDVPGVLRHLGLPVALLDDEALVHSDLGDLDTIVVGIRAFNTRPALAQARDRLLAWVERGGTLVAQYAVPRGLVTDLPGPYPLSLSRDRVTDEDAPVRLLHPDHPLLGTPHAITERDFRGWVQERGLYFADRWDPAYTPLLAMADPGEQLLEGGLLVARHGKGTFIYTGLAFFRQLPAGVPGAVRLFLNLLVPRGSDV